ncbi:MAG: hypothetical protein M1827_006881 [Pycnora praestabilis]|nr:MAG: hypothetical protein M1827_006881 [Pycnora praestabilis]
MSILFYRRPDYIQRSSGPLNQSECQLYVERSKKSRSAIPNELSFENIITNKALPPCQLADFMDYLVYVEHDAENLQFYLWLEDYAKRFNEAAKMDQCLSPEWKKEDNDAPLSPTFAPNNRESRNQLGMPKDLESPFGDKPPHVTVTSDTDSFTASTIFSPRSTADANSEANANAGLKWQPFTIQPFRSEIDRIIAHYLAPGSPRELNLSHRDRSAVLHALQHTTHPSAFANVRTIIDASLRGQSHTNFVRWSICNGNKPRVLAVQYSSGLTVGLGFLIAILLTLSDAARWWRIFAAIQWFPGLAGLIAAYQGLCVIMHHSHSRALHPWEEPEDHSSLYPPDDDEVTLHSSANANDDTYSMSKGSNAGNKRPRSLDSFGTSNSFSDASWVEKYKRKPILRKIFDRNVWVRDPQLRWMQDRIVLKSNIFAAIITVVLTVVFVALPKGNFY